MSTHAPNQPSERSAAKTGKLEGANRLLVVLTSAVALLVTIAGILGIKLNNTTEEKAAAQGTAQTLEVVVSTLQVAQTQNSSELQAASAQIESLNSVVSSLQATHTAAAAVSSPTTGDAGPNAPAGTVRHSGSVTLVIGGDGVNLDAPANDPRWSGAPDITFTSFESVLNPVGGAELLLLAAPPPTIDAGSCGLTGYSRNGIPTSSLSKGTVVCVLTDQKRYSVLTVSSLSQDNLVFDAITYDPPIS